MKTRWFAITIVILLVSISAVFAASLTPLLANIVQYNIVVNGEEKKFNDPVVTINDRTYIPLREAGEILGMDVEWSEETKTVTMNTKKQQESKLYPFMKEQLYGYMDETGNIVIEPQYTNAREFSDGLAFVTYSDGRKGYINASGELIISGRFLIPGLFSEGYAAVVIRPYKDDEEPNITDTPGPYIYIDKQGNDVFSKEFLYAGSFHESFAEVYTIDGYKTFINTSGEQMTYQDFTSISSFIDGYASVSLYDENSPLTIPCILDTDFNLQKFTGLKEVQMTNGGYAVARKGSKYGVINKSGEFVIPSEFKQIDSFGEGLYRCITLDDTETFYNTSGEEIIPH